MVEHSPGHPLRILRVKQLQSGHWSLTVLCDAKEGKDDCLALTGSGDDHAIVPLENLDCTLQLPVMRVITESFLHLLSQPFLPHLFL